MNGAVAAKSAALSGKRYMRLTRTAKVFADCASQVLSYVRLKGLAYIDMFADDAYVPFHPADQQTTQSKLDGDCVDHRRYQRQKD